MAHTDGEWDAIAKALHLVAINGRKKSTPLKNILPPELAKTAKRVGIDQWFLWQELIESNATLAEIHEEITTWRRMNAERPCRTRTCAAVVKYPKRYCSDCGAKLTRGMEP